MLFLETRRLHWIYVISYEFVIFKFYFLPYCLNDFFSFFLQEDTNYNNNKADDESKLNNDNESNLNTNLDKDAIWDHALVKIVEQVPLPVDRKWLNLASCLWLIIFWEETQREGNNIGQLNVNVWNMGCIYIHRKETKMRLIFLWASIDLN